MNVPFETWMLPGVFFLGLCATLTSFILLVYFTRSKKRVGKAVAFMLLGEFLTMLMTTIFAWCEMHQASFGFSPGINSMLRFIMLGVTMASSIHLTWTISKI